MFESRIIPKESAYRIREQFIDLYVDTSCETYVKYIKSLKATDVVYGYGMRVSFLYDCLKVGSYYTEEFHKAVNSLRKLENRQVFVMWDIRPKKHIYPDSSPTIPYPYARYFLSDTVLQIEAGEVAKILLHDVGIHPTEQYWGEDLYILDDSLRWYIAFTHNEMASGDNACYVSLEAFNTEEKSYEDREQKSSLATKIDLIET